MLLQRHHLRVCRKKHKSRVKTNDSIAQNQSSAHNAQAQRVFKTAPLFAVTNPTPTATQAVLDAFNTFFESLWSPSTATTQKSGMSYVYDEDGTLIADTLTGGASTTWGQSAKYIYLPTASGPMPVAAIYGTKHYAIQSDHLNTPRRLVQSDGQVAWQWGYSAFGDEKPTIASNRFANADLNQSFGTTTVPAVTFNLRYPGQYFDQESNLHYNYHRSYSATVGRYTQSDPIGLDGGWNRFNYAELNPLEFTDPEGLLSCPAGMRGFCLPIPPSPRLYTEKEKCIAKCIITTNIKGIVVAGVVGGAGYLGIASGLIPLGAVIVGTYVYQQYGKYYTLIKFAYTSKKCIEECEDCK